MLFSKCPVSTKQCRRQRRSRDAVGRGSRGFFEVRGPAARLTEYNVGHYRRPFSLSNKIDLETITAELKHGVLTVTLPKAQAAKARRIEFGSGRHTRRSLASLCAAIKVIAGNLRSERCSTCGREGKVRALAPLSLP